MILWVRKDNTFRRYCRISSQSGLCNSCNGEISFWGRRDYALGIAESLHNQGLCNDETCLWGRGIMCSRDRKIPYQSSHIIPSMIPSQRNGERSNKRQTRTATFQFKCSSKSVCHVYNVTTAVREFRGHFVSRFFYQPTCTSR